MDPQPLGNLSLAMTKGRSHPPVDFNPDGFIVTTHRSTPSGPLAVKWSGWRSSSFLASRGIRSPIVTQEN